MMFITTTSDKPRNSNRRIGYYDAVSDLCNLISADPKITRSELIMKMLESSDKYLKGE